MALASYVNNLTMPDDSSINSLFSEWQKLEETAFSMEREATIIFIDLAESTAFKDNYGIVNGVRKVIAFNQTITDIIKKHGDRYVNEGRIQECEICKYIGDEVMVYIMGENSARIAVDISIAIQTTLKHKNESINPISRR